jgi:predicted ATPase
MSDSNVICTRLPQDILAPLGENAQVIIDVIPELERLIGKQPTMIELSDSAN